MNYVNNIGEFSVHPWCLWWDECPKKCMMLIDNGPKRAASQQSYICCRLLPRQFCMYDVGLRISRITREVFEQFLGLHRKIIIAAAAAICQ